MTKRDVIVVGASAGGLEALTRLVRHLPAELPAALVVVMHISEESVLPLILEREGALPAAHARDGEPLLSSRIYVAPPGHHTTIEGDRLVVKRGPRENGHRPAIDPLFRSAARNFRERAAGVILSGQLDDGVAGLFSIHARRGATIVQSPDDAGARSMPENALRFVEADHVAPAAEIGGILTALARGDPVRKETNSKHAQPPKRASKAKGKVTGRGVHAAKRPNGEEQDPLRCPDCNGPLYVASAGELIRWECREGHVFSPESLNGAQTEALEKALWMAMRTMKERALVDRTVARSGREKLGTSKERMLERAAATERDMQLIREILDRL